MKRFLNAFILVIALSTALFAQHEYAPIEKKEIGYRDWTYRNALTDEEMNLREFAKDKKLVLVFYFAPWCHSSRYQAPVTQRFFEKYSGLGLGIIGVSMYDSVDALKLELKRYDLSFPVVVESTELSARRRSQHYKYRWSTGDHRKWGTPWNIFLITNELRPNGDLLTESAFVANGELVEEEAEAFIREKLGLPPVDKGSAPKDGRSEEVFEECKTDGGR